MFKKTLHLNILGQQTNYVDIITDMLSSETWYEGEFPLSGSEMRFYLLNMFIKEICHLNEGDNHF